MAVADESATQALASRGYRSELPRRLNMLSIFGLSFAIMAVPFGLSTTLYITLTNGQAVTILYGWLLVSLVSLCLAASLAEICAVFPTAGGVYYWSAVLSPRPWAPLVSFVDGWLTLVGNWTVTLFITFSGAQLILSAVSLFCPSFVASPAQTVFCFWAVMLVCALVNAFASRHLDLVILVTLLAMADRRRDAAFVFTHYDDSASGWLAPCSFFVGLLQSAYTLTGYGMVAAMCEEVQSPEREVPRAMVLSVFAATINGIIFILPLLFVLPDVQMLLRVANSQPIGLLFKTVTGSTAASYGVPVLVSLVRRRELLQDSPFPLGRFGTLINVGCVIWVAFTIVIFCMPVLLPIDASSMNYASVVFAAFAAVAFIWYFVHVCHNFTGSPVLRLDSPPRPPVVAGPRAADSETNSAPHLVKDL